MFIETCTVCTHTHNGTGTRSSTCTHIRIRTIIHTCTCNGTAIGTEKVIKTVISGGEK
jgi:hypothetical protein